MTEREMIEGCCRGDALAQKELYDRFAGRMYGLCCRYVADRSMAHDLLHDGFITIYTKIDEFRGEGSFEGWCRRIFVNTALGYLRKSNPLTRSDEIDGTHPLSDRQQSALEKLTAQELMDCIRELPDGYRTILNLYAVEGYSHREVAEMLSISENTSRSQYFRARNRLQEILKNKKII